MSDFLERTHDAIAAALADKVELEGWSMTHPAYAHLPYDEGHFGRAQRVYIGGEAPEQFYQLPNRIVPGPDHSFTLHTAAGPYNEHGLITYPYSPPLAPRRRLR